ncbi:MAG: hypothetical protein ACYTHK_20350 [Planctomycetota bacterium]|jgi:ketosteroid isomerase-like protein
MRGLVALLLLTAVAVGQDPKNLKKAFELILKGGAVPKANELLHDDFVAWLSQTPEAARAVCEGAANAVRKTAKRYPSDWEDIVAKLLRATDQMGDAEADELAARAEALLVRARFNDDPQRSPGPEDWLASAALYEKADAADDEGGATSSGPPSSSGRGPGPASRNPTRCARRPPRSASRARSASRSGSFSARSCTRTSSRRSAGS